MTLLTKVPEDFSLNPITICEVGPRDGLQNEAQPFDLDFKERLVHELINAGVRQIEIGSFVSPKAVPAMADTDQLMARLHGKRPFKAHAGLQPIFLGLVVNEKGLERALEAGVDGVCIVAVVSDSLSAKNNRCSALESFQTAAHLVRRAKVHGLFTRVDIATAWNCPYEGLISLAQVTPLADLVWELSPDELAFCDSIGYANPIRVAELFQFFGDRYGFNRLAAHFHDTKGLGLANATAAIMTGVRRLDASIGGLGGCPFAPGAKGNLATEDLVHLIHEMGWKTGINCDELWKIVDFCKTRLGKAQLGGQTASWFHSHRSQGTQSSKSFSGPM